MSGPGWWCCGADYPDHDEGCPQAPKVGPFPQEPAPGSAEAVEQSTGTLRWKLNRLRLGAHLESANQQLYETAVTLLKQRDALAGALEALDEEVCDMCRDLSVSLADDRRNALRAKLFTGRAALRLAGRLP